MSIYKLTPLTILLLLGSIWGTGYSIARFAMTNGVTPLGYSFWQSVGPAILMGIIGLLRHKKISINLYHLRYYFVSGFTGIMVPNTTMYFIAAHLPAGLLAVIVNTVPIVAYPMAILTGIERFQWLRFSGVMCAVTGLMLITLPSSTIPSTHEYLWILIALITPLSFAFCSVYISRYKPDNSDSLSLATGTLFASSIMLAPLVLMSHQFYSLHMPFNSPDYVILLEIILSSIGYVLFFQLLKTAGPVYYSLVDTVVSLTGLFWGYMIFHEKINALTGCAVFFILMGLILVSQRNALLELAPTSRTPH